MNRVFRVLVCITVLGFMHYLHASDKQTQKPEQHKVAVRDASVDEQETQRLHTRALLLLKKYAQKYTPIIVSDEESNILDITFGYRNWRVTYGQSIALHDYPLELYLYVGRHWRELGKYQLWVQKDRGDDSGVDRTIYDDLEYTYTYGGLGGALYYFTSQHYGVSLGIEAEMLGVSRLTISSEDANKEYEVNGISLLSVPLWHNATVTPFKVRYVVFPDLTISGSIQYLMYEIWQKDSEAFKRDPNTIGDWISGCSKKICVERDYFASFGMQFTF